MEAAARVHLARYTAVNGEPRFPARTGVKLALLSENLRDALDLLAQSPS